MPGPWLLLTLALTLTLTGVPGGRAQPEAAPGEATERRGLDDLLHLLLLPENLQRLQGDPSQRPGSQMLEPNWLSKRQHPGKREEEEEEEEAEEGVEEEEERGGAGGPQRRQHPGRREEEASPFVDGTRHKRQHPGRRSPWPGYAVTKRQHPGRRRVDPKAQRNWEEEEEEEELTPEKRQHPGKRSPGRTCGPQGACGPASVLLGLLGDLRRGQGTEQKRQHPGRRAAWVREPLEG
ncbi:thyrotropin releasing hormone [Lemur catta]|uniref:thyrotropin releasing hormone n=1 Tax=Lemur catta TaxID=9447 RepID=UPI001E26DBAE|nr:thyrotropin releasing hormone [Lemur catta]